MRARAGCSALGTLKSRPLVRRLGNDEYAHGLFQTEGGKGRQHSSPRPLISRSSSSSDSHIKVTPSKDTCAQTPQASRGTHRKWGEEEMTGTRKQSSLRMESSLNPTSLSDRAHFVCLGVGADVTVTAEDENRSQV